MSGGRKFIEGVQTHVAFTFSFFIHVRVCADGMKRSDTVLLIFVMLNSSTPMSILEIHLAWLSHHLLIGMYLLRCSNV